MPPSHYYVYSIIQYWYRISGDCCRKDLPSTPWKAQHGIVVPRVRKKYVREAKRQLPKDPQSSPQNSNRMKPKSLLPHNLAVMLNSSSQKKPLVHIVEAGVGSVARVTLADLPRCHLRYWDPPSEPPQGSVCTPFKNVPPRNSEAVASDL